MIFCLYYFCHHFCFFGETKGTIYCGDVGSPGSVQSTVVLQASPLAHPFSVFSPVLCYYYSPTVLFSCIFTSVAPFAIWPPASDFLHSFHPEEERCKRDQRE